MIPQVRLRKKKKRETLGFLILLFCFESLDANSYKLRIASLDAILNSGHGQVICNSHFIFEPYEYGIFAENETETFERVGLCEIIPVLYCLSSRYS